MSHTGKRVHRAATTQSWWIGCLLVLVACSGKSDPHKGAEQSVSQLVGAEGATLESSDGAVRLVIPQGALGQQTRITVAPATNYTEVDGLLPGTVYTFGPDGTVFADPVEISIHYDPERMPRGIAASSLQLRRAVGNAWKEMPGSRVDEATERVTGTTTSFSTYGLIGTPTASRAADAGPEQSTDGQTGGHDAREVSPDASNVQAGDASDSRECIPGTRKWCDGTTYCGWGIATCGEDGRWPLVERAGQWIERCIEDGSGLRPDTPCACRYYFFNSECCERPDCVIPANTNGQVCQPSAGGYCDPCSLETPECTAGRLCAVFQQLNAKQERTFESFCTGMSCEGPHDCDEGQACVRISTRLNSTQRRCVPEGGSCQE